MHSFYDVSCVGSTLLTPVRQGPGRGHGRAGLGLGGGRPGRRDAATRWGRGARLRGRSSEARESKDSDVPVRGAALTRGKGETRRRAPVPPAGRAYQCGQFQAESAGNGGAEAKAAAGAAPPRGGNPPAFPAACGGSGGPGGLWQTADRRGSLPRRTPCGASVRRLLPPARWRATGTAAAAARWFVVTVGGRVTAPFLKLLPAYLKDFTDALRV
jgi:hypothetical protein